MKSVVAPLGLFVLALSDAASALRFPVTAKRAATTDRRNNVYARYASEHHGNLERRANVYGVSALDNTNDLHYYTDITLNGTTFSVLIDTGSSDLWIAGTVPGASDTGYTSGVTYAVGEVKGPVMQATLEFAGHTVFNQAYLQITPDEENPKGQGLIGLGPNSGSNIFSDVGGQYGGAAPVDRIFHENTSTPNFITTLLGRAKDPTDTFQGDVTVSEVVSGYEAITNAPKLPISQVSYLNTPNQHWQTTLDSSGILVNGKAITLPASDVAGSNNLVAVFDTGFSIPQVPKAVADAMFSNVDGAQYVNISGLGETWAFDCDKEINISFKFGGVEFPIHPLDANLDVNGTTKNGDKFCIGGFQPISTDNGGNFDMILGMAFIRNAYMLINYGDFLLDATTTAAPYIQLLPLTTDAAEAHSDFQKVRVSGASSSGGSGTSTGKNPSSTGSASGASAVRAVGVALGVVALSALSILL